MILIKKNGNTTKEFNLTKLLQKKKADLTWKTKTSFGAHQAHQSFVLMSYIHIYVCVCVYLHMYAH
jgi:hypothetical protein